MITNSLQDIALRMAEFDKHINKELALYHTSEKAFDGSVELKISVFSPDFCSLYISSTSDCFDVTFGGRISVSDIDHREFDLFKVLKTVAKGDIIIGAESFMGISASVWVQLIDDGRVYFNSRDIKIPFVSKMSNSSVKTYKSFYI